MRNFLILLLLQCFCSLAEEQGSFEHLLNAKQPPYDLWKYELDNINYSDSIDYREAEIIIKNFAFTSKAEGCGATGIIVDYGIYWKVATYSGFSANKGKSIFINKKSGRIAQDGKTLFSHPSEMEMIYPIDLSID